LSLLQAVFGQSLQPIPRGGYKDASPLVGASGDTAKLRYSYSKQNQWLGLCRPKNTLNAGGCLEGSLPKVHAKRGLLGTSHACAVPVMALFGCTWWRAPKAEVHCKCHTFKALKCQSIFRLGPWLNWKHCPLGRDRSGFESRCRLTFYHLSDLLLDRLIRPPIRPSDQALIRPLIRA
jgi:hypothetical protein